MVFRTRNPHVVIRTPLVELSSLEAVAYRQKMHSGQSGVVILRHDCAQPVISSRKIAPSTKSLGTSSPAMATHHSPFSVQTSHPITTNWPGNS